MKEGKEVGVWIVYDLEANREIQKLLLKKRFTFRFEPSLEITEKVKNKQAKKKNSSKEKSVGDMLWGEIK